MADTMRSSMMPTIKCSMCAQEIEISMMGDHVCAPMPAEPTVPLDSNGNFYSRPAYARKPSNGNSLLKPGRLPPPMVDTSAANRPFLKQDLLTPISASSDSRGTSPRTPNDMPRSPYGRRPSQPAHMMSPPSPEILSSNLDNAFPPFPTKKGLSPALKGSNFAKEIYAEADIMLAPKSPGLMGTGQLLQRMNSIAPGPFDPKMASSSKAPSRSGSGKNLQPAPVLERVRTAESDRSHARTPSIVESHHSRSSTVSFGRGQLSGSLKSMPKLERTNGYGGFGPPPSQEENTYREPLNRAQTFPKEATSHDASPTSYMRRPSEPNISNHRSSTENNELSDFGGQDSASSRQRGPPDASHEHSRTMDDLTMRTEPIRLRKGSNPAHSDPAAEYGIGNPYHTPNLSSSSNGSERSGPSLASSRSSPPSDAGRGRRMPSETSNIDQLMSNLQSSMPKQIIQTSPIRNSPPKYSNSLPNEQYTRRLQPPRIDMAYPESPIDPAVHNGHLSPIPSRSDSRPTLNRAATDAAPKRPTTAKGNCKGCGEAIKGKSVSSADGRLTGRYHKACFVCKTCKEPFSTTTFYVLNDSPYCERHYHQLNNSMCKTCDRGIEGQYLQTERGTKHHPHCLTCQDCKVILKEDYFEMAGRVYCQRDAMRRAQQQQGRGMLGVPGGPSSRMERRTTRLMMI